MSQNPSLTGGFALPLKMQVHKKGVLGNQCLQLHSDVMQYAEALVGSEAIP